jgi:hypothetical protein
VSSLTSSPSFAATSTQSSPLRSPFFLVIVLGEFSPLPILAVGMLGMLGIVLLGSIGVLPLNERSLFTAVGFVVFIAVLLTFASIASAESTEECVFEE